MLIDVVRRAGQGVLNVLPLGGVKDDLDAQLVAFQPERPNAVAAPIARVANG
jgi:hypothetical protein